MFTIYQTLDSILYMCWYPCDININPIFIDRKREPKPMGKVTNYPGLPGTEGFSRACNFQCQMQENPGPPGMVGGCACGGWWMMATCMSSWLSNHHYLLWDNFSRRATQLRLSHTGVRKGVTDILQNMHIELLLFSHTHTHTHKDKEKHCIASNLHSSRRVKKRHLPWPETRNAHPFLARRAHSVEC